MSTASEIGICISCGRAQGRFDPTSNSVGTFSTGRCGWCGEIKPVTSPADYGYPKPPETKEYAGDCLDD